MRMRHQVLRTFSGAAYGLPAFVLQVAAKLPPTVDTTGTAAAISTAAGPYSVAMTLDSSCDSFLKNVGIKFSVRVEINSLE
jgi:hypothetical protein